MQYRPGGWLSFQERPKDLRDDCWGNCCNWAREGNDTGPQRHLIPGPDRESNARRVRVQTAERHTIGDTSMSEP